MYLLQIIYPFILGSVNIATGWLLYHLIESVFGGLFVLIGVLVILALIGSTVSEHRPVLRKPA